MCLKFRIWIEVLVELTIPLKFKQTLLRKQSIYNVHMRTELELDGFCAQLKFTQDVLFQ